MDDLVHALHKYIRRHSSNLNLITQDKSSIATLGTTDKNSWVVLHGSLLQFPKSRDNLDYFRPSQILSWEAIHIEQVRFPVLGGRFFFKFHSAQQMNGTN